MGKEKKKKGGRKGKRRYIKISIDRGRLGSVAVHLYLRKVLGSISSTGKGKKEGGEGGEEESHAALL